MVHHSHALSGFAEREDIFLPAGSVVHTSDTAIGDPVELTEVAERLTDQRARPATPGGVRVTGSRCRSPVAC